VMAPEVTCVLDVSVRRGDSPAGWVQVRSSQALRGGRVTAVTSSGSRAELARWAIDEWAIDEWATRLAMIATVPVPAAPSPPAPEVDVPLELLLGAGEALRTHRPELLDELVRRAGSDDPTETRDQLVRLHTAVVGRLLATVAGRDGRAGARAGWVSWLLFADGWRALTPTRVAGRPGVRVEAVEPSRLGVQVARLVSVVLGRS
jgi:hypothetical protein